MPPTQTSIEEGQFIEIYPLASLSQGAPIEFTISGATSEYVDLSNTFLHVQAKVTKADGTNLDAGAAVAPVNNFLHSLFSQVDISLNGVLVTNSENTYPYRAMLETLLNYSREAQKHGLIQASLFARDTPGHMEDREGTDNEGLVKRRTAAAQSGVIDMMGRLHTDIMSQGRYMLNGVDIKIRLTSSKNEFCLLSHGVQNPRAVITHASLFVRKSKLNPAITLAHAKALEKSAAKYPVKRVLVKNFSIPTGNLGAVQDNLFLSQTPKRIVLALVDSASLNGDYTRNPFNFQHKNLNFLGITVDGKHVPAKPLTPDFEGGRWTRAFVTTLVGMGAVHQENGGCGVALGDFSSGYAIFCFDLSPSLLDGDQFELVKSSALRLELKFSAALDQPVVVLVYAELDGVIEIDRTRQVLTDFGV